MPTTAASSHGGVLDEDVLDLARRDVLGPADDHVVEASGEVQVALGVEPAAVAGGEPAGVDRSAVAPEVLAGDLLAPHPHLALLDPAGRTSPSASRTVTSRPGSGRPTDPRRARTAGSSLAMAVRWSSGPSTLTVELVSVRP